MKYTYSFVIILFLLCFNSCKTLEWRHSDSEIKETFNQLNIPTEISYFEVDSLNLKIRTQAVKRKNNKINLVFVHGSPSSLSAWHGYLKDTLLVQKANLYAIDRPGYGYSNFGEQMPSITLQTQLISDVIDNLKLDNCIVIGSSYGGPIVARLAVINSKVKAVVMISPAIDPELEKDVWGSRLTQWKLTRWLVPPSYRVAGDEKTIHAQELQKITYDWAKVTVPVIHIHGNQDDLVSYENTLFSKKFFKNSTIVTTSDTGHEIAWARPELIKPTLFEVIEMVFEDGN